MGLSQEPQNNMFRHWLAGIQFLTDHSNDPVLIYCVCVWCLFV